jgi:hypothetical protein
MWKTALKNLVMEVYEHAEHSFGREALDREGDVVAKIPSEDVREVRSV